MKPDLNVRRLARPAWPSPGLFPAFTPESGPSPAVALAIVNVIVPGLSPSIPCRLAP